jgi:hypothetical protein
VTGALTLAGADFTFAVDSQDDILVAPDVRLILNRSGTIAALQPLAYDLADYLIPQPGAYIIERWHDEEAPQASAEYETRWIGAVLQQQIGEEDWALVTEGFIAYPDSIGAENLVRDTEYLGLTDDQVVSIGNRHFLPRDDDNVLDLLLPPIAVDRRLNIGESVSGTTTLFDRDGNPSELPWALTLVGATTASTPAGDFDDCLDLSLAIGDWTSEQTVCRGLDLVAARDSDADGVTVMEAVALGLEPAGSCSPPEFNPYEARMLDAYFSYYGRPADAAGLAYWSERLENEGGNLSSVIDAFGNSAEFDRRFGGLDNETLVTNIYHQVLGRDPDPAGLAFYVGELDAGRMSLETIALNVLDGVQGDDVAMVENRLLACGHSVGRQRALGDGASAIQDTVLARVIAGIGTGVLGTIEAQADAACAAFDDLSGIDPSIAASVFSTEYLSAKTLYQVWFGQGYDDLGNPLVGDVPVVLEAHHNADGTLIAIGLLNHHDVTSTWALDDTGLLYFDGNATEGNRVACGHTADYIRTYYVVHDQLDNVDLFFFDRDAALSFAAGLTQGIPPCTVPEAAAMIPEADGD